MRILFSLLLVCISYPVSAVTYRQPSTASIIAAQSLYSSMFASTNAAVNLYTPNYDAATTKVTWTPPVSTSGLVPYSGATSAVDLGANKISTIGVSFPASQTTDSGANVLDDYEEGTWDGAFSCGTSGTITINSSYKTGKYTKIGRMVTITGDFRVDSVSSPVGALTLTGLPFDNGPDDSNNCAVSLYTTVLNSTGTTTMMGWISPSSSAINIRHFSAGSSGTAAADVKAGSIFIINATYFIN